MTGLIDLFRPMLDDDLSEEEEKEEDDDYETTRPPAKRRCLAPGLTLQMNDDMQKFFQNLLISLQVVVNGSKDKKSYKPIFNFSIILDEPLPSDDLNCDSNKEKKTISLWIHRNLEDIMLVIQRENELQSFTGAISPSSNLPLSKEFFFCLDHHQTFILSIEKFNNKNESNLNELTVEVILTTYNIKNCSLDDQVTKAQNRYLMKVMSTLFNIPLMDSPLPCGSKEPPLYHVEEVYAAVRKHHEDNVVAGDFLSKIEGFYPNLREYQKKAIQWMLNREKIANNVEKVKHPLWTFVEQINLQYNYYFGYFREAIGEPIMSSSAFGGILADEMGLGKTVEILALILSHPRSNSNIEAPQPEIFTKDSKLNFNGQFLCRCGTKTATEDLTPIQCIKCTSYQHKECINYNEAKWSSLPYYCPFCWTDPSMPKLKSRATLIITPHSIYHQWQDEITKHLDCSSLDILLYPGVSSKYIYPYDLADKDIILASYESFKSEVRFVGLSRENRLRRPKKFNLFPTPLVAIEWWRVVFDEAQMVEGVSSQAATMANHLVTINRWCITGTPIQKSINDIYGLVLFIGEQPYCDKHYWKVTIADQYYSGNMEPLTNLLKRCFWRNSKKDVAHELGLPEREEHVIKLDFAPIEEHFYLQQKEKCVKIFADNIISFDDLNVSLKKIDHKSYTKLINPLLKLRQACCHPQVVGNHFLSIAKKIMTMDEVLEDMIKRTCYACEEDHRKMIASLNGQAGIYIIKENLAKAVEIYRKVLLSIESFKENFRTDKLQLYHTLYNLADVLELIKMQSKSSNNNSQIFSSPELSSSPSSSLLSTITTSSSTLSSSLSLSSDKELINKSQETENNILDTIGHTLRDDSLKKDAENLRNEYLSKGMQQIEEAQAQLKIMISNTKKQESILGSHWWLDALGLIVDWSEDEQFLIRVKDQLEERALRSLIKQGKVYQFLIDKYREIAGLEYIIKTGLDELKNARKDLIASVKIINAKPSDEEFNDAVDCHLRPTKDERGKVLFKKKCLYCSVHEKFNNYESKLFYFAGTTKIETELDKESALFTEQRRGNWSDSEIEQVLKILFSTISRNTHVDQILLDNGSKMLEFFDLMKKEFKCLRAVWMNIYDYVSRLDELNMATIRLRKRFPDEPKQDETVKYILEENEIDANLMSLQSDETINRSELKKNLSHLNFLSNLQKNRMKGANPDPCPICTCPLGLNWSAFKCGHYYCLPCTDMMIDDRSTRDVRSLGIKCAICRQRTKVNELVYVDARDKDSDESTDKIKVLGSWSTKVEEIIRTILKIHRDEPNAKCLVFSTWNTFLTLLSRALEVNRIQHIIADKPKTFAANVDAFKNDDISVLLMPITLGSRGLNLIEANHVLLVEPLLDPSHEYQAIGRIHRIGQRKSTHVYKFIIKQTIEEKINEMFSLQCKFNDFSDLQADKRTCSTIKDIQELMFYD